MCSDLVAVLGCVTRQRDASATTTPSDALVAEIDDALTTGYACALAADGCLMRLEERLREAVADASGPGAGRLRALGDEHARLREDLTTLRQALAGLRSDRDRVLARLPARSR
jgi:hypothetical protein